MMGSACMREGTKRRTPLCRRFSLNPALSPPMNPMTDRRSLCRKSWSCTAWARDATNTIVCPALSPDVSPSELSPETKLGLSTIPVLPTLPPAASLTLLLIRPLAGAPPSVPIFATLTILILLTPPE